MAIKAYVPGRHEVQTGIYSYFEMVVKNAVAEGSRGVVAIPIKADWGPVREFVELKDEIVAKETFGTGKTAHLLKLAFLGQPLLVKAYRMATSEAKKAELTLDVIKLTALYPGERGNNFLITIRPTLEAEGSKELLITEGATLLESYVFATTAELIEKLNESEYVRASNVTTPPPGVTIPADTSSSALQGGNSGENVTTLEYAEFLNAAGAEEFNAITTDGVKDTAIKKMFIQFVRDNRPVGKLIKAYVGGLNGVDIDYYPIINLIQWAEKDGVRYTAEEVAIYFACCASAHELSESIAMKVTPFDRVQKIKTTEIDKKIREGNLTMYQEGRVVRVNTPVNTMVTIKNFDNLIRVGDGADEEAVIRTLCKIKIIEAFDYISEAEETLFKRFISKANSAARRNATAEMIKNELLLPLEEREIIERGTGDCIVDTDFHGPKPIRNAYKDEAYFITSFTILDAAEKIYNVNQTS